MGQGRDHRGRAWRALVTVIAVATLGALATAAPLGASAPKSLVPVVAEDLPLILIDPGHGGTNTGAPSVRPDIFEKHVTLALAGSLRKHLQDRGFEVRLTRTRDEYLTLRQRGRMANELDADLLVSLHANATESHSQSGYETYILTPEAVDIDSPALRRSSGRLRDGVTGDLAALLDDVERSTTQVRAADVGASIQGHLRTLRGRAGDRGVRQDSMHVLLGATMPAVLIEVGFIDHPIEGEELMDPLLRDKIALSLAEAIADHRDALQAR